MSTPESGSERPTAPPPDAQSDAPSAADDVFSALVEPSVRLDPYPRYAAYRDSHGVLDTGFGVKFFFRHADCLTLLRDRRVSVDERNSPLTGEINEPQYPALIKIDPPDHERLRRLVQAAFTPRRVEGLRRRAEELVATAIDRLRDLATADLIAEVAYPVPLTIIGEMLGIDPDDYPMIQEWSTWLARSIDPGVFRSAELNTAIEQAESAFADHLRALIARRRRRPGDDLLSQMVGAEMDGDRLTERELLGLALLLLVAGHETTVNLIGNGMLALLRHPAEFAAAADGAHHPDGRRRMIDELLRYDSPVQMTSRVALERLEVGADATLERGEIAVVMLGAANHDPAVFDSPDRLDTRAIRTGPHLSFGQGIHHCLGAALARAEGEAAIAALTRAFPRMSLIDPEPAVREAFILRGREHLRVSLH